MTDTGTPPSWLMCSGVVPDTSLAEGRPLGALGPGEGTDSQSDPRPTLHMSVHEHEASRHRPER